MFLHVSVILFTGGGWYPSMHFGWYPSMPCSRSRGGGVTQHALQVSRPTPRWEVEGSGQDGSPGPHPGGVSRPTPGGCIPACPEADTPQETATAAGGTHPTGMHSCQVCICAGVFMHYICLGHKTQTRLSEKFTGSTPLQQLPNEGLD